MQFKLCTSLFPMFSESDKMLRVVCSFQLFFMVQQLLFAWQRGVCTLRC